MKAQPPLSIREKHGFCSIHAGLLEVRKFPGRQRGPVSTWKRGFGRTSAWKIPANPWGPCLRRRREPPRPKRLLTTADGADALIAERACAALAILPRLRVFCLPCTCPRFLAHSLEFYCEGVLLESATWAANGLSSQSRGSSSVGGAGESGGFSLRVHVMKPTKLFYAWHACAESPIIRRTAHTLTHLCSQPPPQALETAQAMSKVRQPTCTAVIGSPLVEAASDSSASDSSSRLSSSLLMSSRASSRPEARRADEADAVSIVSTPLYLTLKNSMFSRTHPCAHPTYPCT